MFSCGGYFCCAGSPLLVMYTYLFLPQSDTSLLHVDDYSLVAEPRLSVAELKA